MPEDKELGPTNSTINRWLDGVQSAIDDGTLCGSGVAERSARCGNQKGQSQPSLLIHHWHSRNDNQDKNLNLNVADLNLESAHSPYIPPCPVHDDTSIPKIPRLPGQRSPRENNNKLQTFHLEKPRVETKFVERKDKQMESNNFNNDKHSDCQLSVTQSVNQLSFNTEDDEEDVTSKKSRSLIARFGTIGSVQNGCTKSLSVVENAPIDLRYETNNAHVRGATPLRRDKAKFSLPSLMTSDTRRHTVHEVPIITVCPDGESRASKAAQQDLDPRFLMPTEASVEEARYLLASRRGSLPCVGRQMRRKSLDMLEEEQSNDPTSGSRAVTSRTSLKVPRHRNRSRSLDNSAETSNSFAAFKESLKLRNVKKNVIGT